MVEEILRELDVREPVAWPFITAFGEIYDNSKHSKIFKNIQVGKEMSINEFKAVVNGGADINIEESLSLKVCLTFSQDNRRDKLWAKLYPRKVTALESENSLDRREIKLRIQFEASLLENNHLGKGISGFSG